MRVAKAQVRGLLFTIFEPHDNLRLIIAIEMKFIRIILNKSDQVEKYKGNMQFNKIPIDMCIGLEEIWKIDSRGFVSTDPDET